MENRQHEFWIWGCVLQEREVNYATPTSPIFHPSFSLGEILKLLLLFAMAMTNKVSRGVCFIDTGLVPWLLLLSFSLSWDQVSKQQVGFLLKIPDATLVDRQRAYVPSFLQTNPESSSMDDPHALCLYLFLHVSKPDPTNKMEMMMSSPILPPHIIFFHQLTAVHTSCLHHFTASKTASNILKPCHFCCCCWLLKLACSSPSCCCCNILIHCQPFQW